MNKDQFSLDLRHQAHFMYRQKASYYISTTRMLMVAPHLANAVHQHAVIQITFSLDGYPFEVWTENSGWQKASAVIINSNIPHSLKNFQGWQVTTCVIPDVTHGKQLQEKVLMNEPIRYLSDEQHSSLKQIVLNLRSQTLADGQAFIDLTTSIYDALIGERSFKGPIDARILHVLNYIHDNINRPISAEALAKEVYLSEDRFLHLFKEQMGAPLRQYILWQRMAVAFKLFIAGKSLKEAALEAGFSDPAHFSRTHTQINGVPPSAYTDLKNHINLVFFLPF